MRQATDSLDSNAGAGQVRPGTVIGGRFRVEAQLAREGGTVLYRATDVRSNAAYGLRTIPFTAVSQGAPNLMADIEKTQALRHKNLVDVEAVGREGDFMFVAAELVDGQSLREFIDAKRAEGRGVSLKGACNLVAHVANALEYASRVTWHGALNPAIIWVSRTGRVKVSGLGIGIGVPGFARHGAPEGASDSLYVAPELLAGGALTGSGDVYALAVILYELLTGQPPGSPYRPSSSFSSEIPPAVDAVIERALSRNPAMRWPSPGAMKEALQQAAGLASAGGGERQTGGRQTSAAFAVVGDSRPVAAAPAPAPTMPPGRAPAGRPAPVGPPPGQGPAFSMGAPASVAPPGARPGAAPGQDSRARPTNGTQGPSGGGASSETANGHANGAGKKGARPAAVVAASPTGLAMAAGVQETEERWLIQKDRLDFGPFTLVQIRAQIERGEILGDHVLMDTDSGSRCKVKEFPGLGDMARNAQRRIEQNRRAQAEKKSEKTQKKKSMFTAVVIVAVAGVVLGGVALFMLTRRDTATGHLASREEEAEIDNFLKGVKIGGMKASVRRGGGHHAGAGSASAGNDAEFSNDSNFGDATKGMEAGDQTLDDDQIQNTMMSNYRKLIPCIVHSPVSNIALEFVVRGTGKVSAVKVNGQRSGPLASCMLGRMQSFNFPHFNGAKTIASWSMSMGR